MVIYFVLSKTQSERVGPEIPYTFQFVYLYPMGANILRKSKGGFIRLTYFPDDSELHGFSMF